MRSHNRIRRALLLLAAVCCLIPALLTHTRAPLQAEAAGSLPDAAYQVRVGVAVPALGSGLYTADLRCGSGFTVGVSSGGGRSFEALFSLGNTA